MGTTALSRGVKAPGREFDTTINSDVKNEWIYASTTSLAFTAWIGTAFPPAGLF